MEDFNELFERTENINEQNNPGIISRVAGSVINPLTWAPRIEGGMKKLATTLTTPFNKDSTTSAKVNTQQPQQTQQQKQQQKQHPILQYFPNSQVKLVSGNTVFKLIDTNNHKNYYIFDPSTGQLVPTTDRRFFF